MVVNYSILAHGVSDPECRHALGIPEYWRFDETTQYHGAQLAGDRLVDGVYVPIPIKELEDSILQGYSATLNLNLQWDHGYLRWHDPATDQHILTYEDQRDRADAAEARVRALEERGSAKPASRDPSRPWTGRNYYTATWTPGVQNLN